MAQKLSDRHFGVGGDGLICICPSETADFKMRMFNADGSEGAMCGNGIRCFGKYVFEKGMISQTVLTVETLSGIRQLSLGVNGDTVNEVTVDMGIPVIGSMTKITVNENSYTGFEVSVGNPHFVIPAEEPGLIDLRKAGPGVAGRVHSVGQVNVEFVCVRDRRKIEMRVWERGSGETLACGTGACAAVAAMAALGHIEREAVVSLPGGELKVRWQEQDDRLLMTGPAVTVYDGTLSEEWLYESDKRKFS